mgnify:CR=1 FL=1
MERAISLGAWMPFHHSEPRQRTYEAGKKIVTGVLHRTVPIASDKIERQAPPGQFRQRHPVIEPVLDHAEEMHEVGLVIFDGEPLVTQEIEAGEESIEQLGL